MTDALNWGLIPITTEEELRKAHISQGVRCGHNFKPYTDGAQTTPTLPRWKDADFRHCFWKDKYFSRFVKAEGGKNETNV